MFDQGVRAEGGECVSDEVRPLRITGARRLRVAQAAASHHQSTAAAPMISLEQTNNVMHIYHQHHMRAADPLHIFQSFTFSTVGRHSRINIIWSIVGKPSQMWYHLNATSAFSIALHLVTKLHISLREQLQKELSKF